jgi:hypothetical protein
MVGSSLGLPHRCSGFGRLVRPAVSSAFGLSQSGHCDISHCCRSLLLKSTSAFRSDAASSARPPALAPRQAAEHHTVLNSPFCRASQRPAAPSTSESSPAMAHSSTTPSASSRARTREEGRFTTARAPTNSRVCRRDGLSEKPRLCCLKTAQARHCVTIGLHLPQQRHVAPFASKRTDSPIRASTGAPPPSTPLRQQGRPHARGPGAATPPTPGSPPTRALPCWRSEVIGGLSLH